MKRVTSLLLVVTILYLTLNACGPSPSPTTTPLVSTPASVPPMPKGETIIVTSAGDDGPGTLRQALQDAQPGDIITFNPVVFPPTAPVTIYVGSVLPPISQSHLTIDASNAGVILDGSRIPEGWNSGISVHSNSNTVRGLQVVGFSGAGIAIDRGQNNLIEKNISCGNDFGIGLWETETSNNTIAGNYLGVLADGATPQGNKSSGITIMGGANNSFVGPDNHIAFNGHMGIEILNANTNGNTIAQNSIHDNGQGGIHLWDGGNGNLAAPILMDFDLATGTVNGIACPNCKVLVYSDGENEGAYFEGESLADNRGVFTLEKGSAFSGPVLTATATDEQGNTSIFSIPTVGSRRTMQLQSRNEYPRTILLTKPSDNLEDNRLGALWSDFWQPVDFQAVIDNEIVPAGLKWVKITMNQAEYYTSEQSGVELYWDKPELFISPEFDDYIDQLVSHKIAISYMLNFWDKANHPNGWDVQYRFKTEEDISHYLEYVRFIVTQFKGRVQYYELWNEPNVESPLQYIEPADYINLAKQTIPLIKQIDPQAKVVVGCTSGSASPQARDYLFQILNSDLMSIADAVSWHPLYDDIPDSGSYPDYYASYPSLLDGIIETAKQNGFRGEFIATEISYGSSSCGDCDIIDPSYSELIWAKYTARGIILHFGKDVAAGVGGLSSQRINHYNTVRNIANVFSGAYAEKSVVEVQTELTNFKIFTFTGIDGSKLITLWTDAVAENDDPGIPSTITIPGFADWEATGIDVLNGLEQELISTNENGDLIVCDLLIKDYPIIIRLSK